MLMRNGIKLDLIPYCLTIIFLFSSGCEKVSQQDKLRLESGKLYEEKKFSESIRLLEQALLSK